MKANLLYICVSFFWALSLVASPLSLLYMQDENVVLALKNASEEESGESYSINPLQEKLIIPYQLPVLACWISVKSEAPTIRPVATKDFVGEVVLPPPEA